MRRRGDGQASTNHMTRLLVVFTIDAPILFHQQTMAKTGASVFQIACFTNEQKENAKIVDWYA